MKSGNAVLIGHNFNSILGLARALGAEGYEVGVIRTGVHKGLNFLRRLGQMPEAKSRYVTKYVTADASDTEEVLSLLTDEFSKSGEKSVLIPVDDACAELIDEHLDLLSGYYYMPNVNGKQGEVVRLMDKNYQKSLAKEAGLPVPEGCSVKIAGGKFQIPDDIRYPCYAKAEMPMPNRKNYMGRCCSKEELINLLSKAAAYRDCLMIVEDYVEIEKEYCIVGFCDRDYILIPDVIDELVLGHGEHAGVTCFGRVISPESLDSGFMDSLKRFLHSTGFTGLFTVDVFESKNRLYFGELNLRIGGSGIAVIGAGVNIAYIAAECLQGHTVDEKDKECREMTFVSERPLVNDLVTGHISLKEYRRFLKDADFRFIDSDDDPAPQKVFKWHIARQFARRLLQKSRH